MRLFLCSYFAEVGTLLENEVAGKNVVFIPTASINEDYKAYVDEAHQLWEQMDAHILKLEISTSSENEIHKAFEKEDIIYCTGGNTFFLIDQLRKTGTDKLVHKHLTDGKLYVGESGGAIVCAKDLSYIKAMDEVPEDFSQEDHSGLGLIDFYVVPHYLCPPFVECSKQILDEYSDLNIDAISNSEVIVVENGKKRRLVL